MYNKIKIIILDFKKGYKKELLEAISQYKNEEIKNLQTTKKKLTLSNVKQLYSKGVVKRIENYLLPINKEVSRDVLTKYNLI